jgi:long-chain acyl-CoA synthetase
MSDTGAETMGRQQGWGTGTSVPNVASLVWDSAERRPEHVALAGGGQRVTYAQLRDRAAAVGGAARGAGVGIGDRVLLVGPVVPEWAIAYYGLLAAGATVVAVNAMSTERELGYFLEDAGCTLAIADETCGGGALAAATAERGVPLWTLASGEDLGAQGGGAPLTGVHAAAFDDTAVLLYTSGTTGKPKGAQLTHGNLLSASDIFAAALRVTGDDTLLCCLPLFHVYGQSTVLNPTMQRGATLIMQTPFEPTETLRLVGGSGVTIFCGVPTMYNALLHAPAPPGMDLTATLRLAVSGGAPNPLEVIRGFEQRFGAVIMEGYGMTETTSAGTFNLLTRPRKVGKVGVALPGVDVKVVRDDGSETGVDEPGEVLFGGPTIMKGYWGRPEATAETLQDGWLRSGDVATRDADGDIMIVDRKKDMIIRGGYNVYPREIEEVLYEHPEVVEAAVVGVDDEHYGQEVAAAVVAAAGSTLDAAALRAWMKERVSGYKYPRIIAFVDEIPKTPSGKLKRREVDLTEAAEAYRAGRRKAVEQA